MLVLSESAWANANCKPGSCTPPQLPPVPPETQKVKTPVNKVIKNGNFSASIPDPSNDDDSFVYYLEHISTTQWKTYSSALQQTNSSCTDCKDVKVSEEVTSGWSNSTAVGFNLGLSLGAPPATTTLGAQISQTIGYTASKTFKLEVPFTLDCCSSNRFVEEIVNEEFEFLQKWQRDDLGILSNWTDMGELIYIARAETPGLAKISALAPCEVPGPFPVMGIAAAFGYSRKLRARIRSNAVHGVHASPTQYM
ncbi:hypothetical protein LBMAG41_14120 [Cyanobium sp.]|nr:hypothetical protein LBMAG41_14120 [Cyanobium sp.]